MWTCRTRVPTMVPTPGRRRITPSRTSSMSARLAVVTLTHTPRKAGAQRAAFPRPRTRRGGFGRRAPGEAAGRGERRSPRRARCGRPFSAPSIRAGGKSAMSTPKRYAMVGLGDRARMYTGAVLGEYRSTGELVALCDVNQSRMRWHNRSFQSAFGRAPVPEYGPQDFERLLDEQRVDVVIVSSVDRTHARYIVAALEHGCDVITEKPLTVDAGSCQRIV